MAKGVSEKIKKEILADYHTNKYSQRSLSKKHAVSIGTVNKITKEVKPQNEHLVNAQVSLLSAKALISDEQMNAIVNTAKDELLNKGLVENAAQLSLIRKTELLSENRKEAIVKNINYNADGKREESHEIMSVVLSPDDLKAIDDGIDKASLTLKVNKRHSNAIITNTNAQQNNNEIVGYNVRTIKS